MDVVGGENGAVRRRELLAGVPGLAAGGLALAGCGAAGVVRAGSSPSQMAATAAPPQQEPGPEEAPVTPPEDLMREHGVLKRILLIYREGVRRIDGGEQVPTRALHAGAHIIRSFIEDYHEHLEERPVFPRLVKAGKLVDTVQVLEAQHRSGRLLTVRILNATSAATAPAAQARRALVADMNAFIRMYEPHEAREDTIVFPALRAVVPAKQFAELAERFEEEEHRRFARGFTGIVDQVAHIEKDLGIYDLSQYTPRA